MHIMNEILTPGLNLGEMHQYEDKSGRVVVMHNNKDEVTTINPKGEETKWKRCDKKIVVATQEVLNKVLSGQAPPPADQVVKMPTAPVSQGVKK